MLLSFFLERKMQGNLYTYFFKYYICTSIMWYNDLYDAGHQQVPKEVIKYRLDNIDSFHEKKMLKENGWGIVKLKSDDISSKKKENIGSHQERIYSLGRK